MKFRQGWNLVGILVFGCTVDVYAGAVSNPCDSLLSIIDRPTVGDSACVVPYKHVVLEMGYQYQQLRFANTSLYNLPEAELRIGLPLESELVVLLPNYIHQSYYSGYTASTLGVKHEVGYNQNWLGAVEALFTLPDGSAGYGSNGLGVAVSGVVSYTFTPQYNLTFMFGVSSLSASSNVGGQRYTSFNPDLIFTYTATDKMDFYVEVYAQTKTSPWTGFGSNLDTGVLYLLRPGIAVDLEVGQRITGYQYGFNHYIGAGLSFMI